MEHSNSMTAHETAQTKLTENPRTWLITGVAGFIGSNYDGIVLAVANDRFKAIGASTMRRFGRADHVLYDLKNILSVQESDLRL